MAQNPTPSKLDQNQIIQRVMDESNDRLRVDATASIESGNMEVIIDEADDSILVYGNDGGTNRKIKTDASGELQVDVLSSALPSGAATSALQTQPGVDIGDVTINNAAGGSAVNIQDGGNSITVDGTVTANAGTGTFAISAASLPLPSGAATSAKQDEQIVLATGNSTATSSNVSVTTASTTLIAANSARKMATFYNDGGGNIYLKLGSAASLTSFMIRLQDNDFFELPLPIYTGIVTAIASAGTRTIRVTEY